MPEAQVSKAALLLDKGQEEALKMKGRMRGWKEEEVNVREACAGQEGCCWERGCEPAGRLAPGPEASYRLKLASKDPYCCSKMIFNFLFTACDFAFDLMAWSPYVFICPCLNLTRNDELMKKQELKCEDGVSGVFSLFRGNQTEQCDKDSRHQIFRVERHLLAKHRDKCGNCCCHKPVWRNVFPPAQTG